MASKQPLRPARLHSCFTNILCGVPAINTKCIVILGVVARQCYCSLCMASSTWISFQWAFTSELPGFIVSASEIISTCLWFSIHKLQVLPLNMTTEFQELSFLFGICPVPTKSYITKHVTINKSRDRNCNPHIISSYLLWKDRADSEHPVTHWRNGSAWPFCAATFPFFFFFSSAPPIIPHIFLQLKRNIICSCSRQLARNCPKLLLLFTLSRWHIDENTLRANFSTYSNVIVSIIMYNQPARQIIIM